MSGDYHPVSHPSDSVPQLPVSLESLSDEQESRFRAGLTDEFFTYPRQGSSYVVVSFGSSQDGPQEYVASYQKDKLPTCGCGDFQYRCLPEESSLRRCKHLWRVWIDLYFGRLPHPDVDTYEWTLQQFRSAEEALRELYNSTENKQQKLVKARLDAVKRINQQLADSTKLGVDYQRTYRLWHKFLDWFTEYTKEKHLTQITA